MRHLVSAASAAIFVLAPCPLLAASAETSESDGGEAAAHARAFDEQPQVRQQLDALHARFEDLRLHVFVRDRGGSAELFRNFNVKLTFLRR